MIYDNYIIPKISGTSSIDSFTFLDDGSFILNDDSSQWNDQFNNGFTGVGLVDFFLSYTEYTSILSYGNINDKLWVKLDLPANSPITINFEVDDNFLPNNSVIFDFYDDFTNWSDWDTVKSGIVEQDTDMFGFPVLKKTGYSDPNGGAKKLNFNLDYPFVFESRINRLNYNGGKADRIGVVDDSGCGYGIHIDHSGEYLRLDRRTNWVGTSYPIEYLNTNFYQTWYKIKFERIDNETYRLYYFDDDNNLLSSGEINDDTYNTFTNVYVLGGFEYALDYLFIRKYYNEDNVSVNINQTSETTYSVDIVSSTDYTGIQIPISIPTDKNYKVSITSITPIINCSAMPFDSDSYITTNTQFNHGVKLNSQFSFHVHVYIPPDSTNGYVKLKLDWLTMPIETIVNETVTTVNSSTKQLKSITKEFQITEDLSGKHVLLDFGYIDTVQSISQIVFSKLTRLATDSEDTWDHDLPILNLDFHTENDSIGSKTEFDKY